MFTWENVKMAHWWPTFEKARVPGNSVREILDEYKNFWPYASLRKLVDPARWTPGSDGQGKMARRIATPKSSSYLLVCERQLTIRFPQNLPPQEHVPVRPDIGRSGFYGLTHPGSAKSATNISSMCTQYFQIFSSVCSLLIGIDRANQYNILIVKRFRSRQKVHDFKARSDRKAVCEAHSVSRLSHTVADSPKLTLKKLAAIGVWADEIGDAPSSS
jgi:hypothetical protein